MAERPKDYSTHYPSDVSDEEWEFCAPYLTLMDPEAPQRLYPLRTLFNSLRYIAKTGVQWRYLPENFPPYHAVYQQAQRWIRAGVLETMAGDLRKLLRMLQDRAGDPSAVILDGRTLQSVPESADEQECRDQPPLPALPPRVGPHQRRFSLHGDRLSSERQQTLCSVDGLVFREEFLHSHGFATRKALNIAVRSREYAVTPILCDVRNVLPKIFVVPQFFQQLYEFGNVHCRVSDLPTRDAR